MKAIILAAGCGVRLRPLTLQSPKCLLEIGGISLLENCLAHLAAVGVERTIIVVGHLKDAIMNKIGVSYGSMAIDYVVAADYETTNNIVSLQCALQSLWATRQLDDDFILAESDVFFGAGLLPAIVGGPSVAVVSHRQPDMNGTVVKTKNGYVTEFLLDGSSDADVYKTVNIYYLTSPLVKTLRIFLDAHVEAGYTQQYYEAVFAELLRKPNAEPLAAHLSDDWAEVDNLEDLARARYKFASQEEKYQTVSQLHGYFWPYGVVDYCHLYNMYFPPPALMDYFGKNLKLLVTTYPSGQRDLAHCLSAWVGVHPDFLAVGNGASEIIRILGALQQGLCVSTPSFNEFETCCARTVPVPLDEESFQFDAQRFLEGLNGSDADCGVIVSPNNPTSLAVSPDDIRTVLAGTNKRVILDESFVDFSDNPSFLPLLEQYPNLVVLKSLGKVFGICGLRLGFIASADRQFVAQIRERLPIWNVNNFAETFVRQMPRYEKSFRQSCGRTKQDRDALYKDLADLGLKVWKPTANFVFGKMPDSVDGVEVARQLFARNILVKHCGGKTMKDGHQYIRFGCRTQAENNALCAHLREVFQSESPSKWIRLDGLRTQPATYIRAGS